MFENITTIFLINQAVLLKFEIQSFFVTLP